MTAQNQTRQGYTVTFDGSTTTTIASGGTHIITCILEITDWSMVDGVQTPNNA